MMTISSTPPDHASQPSASGISHTDARPHQPPHATHGFPQHMFQTMVERSPDAVLSVTGSSLDYANPAARALFGYDDHTWATLTLIDLHAPSDRHRIAEVGNELAAHGAWYGVIQFQRATGDTFPAEIRIFTLDGAGDAATHVGIIRDLSDQRLREQQLLVQAQQLHAGEQRLRIVLDNLPIAMISIDSAGIITYSDGAGLAAFNLQPGQLQGTSIFDTYENDTVRIAAIRRALAGEAASTTSEFAGRYFNTWFVPLHTTQQASEGALGIAIDVTDQRRAEIERTQYQEELIAAQQATLTELSTPLIPLANGVVVMPLIGNIDSRRAQQVIETLLTGVATNHAQIVLLDITGVPIVDTQVANAFVRAAQAVKLLGAQIVLTGIRPEVAQTLVGLGADLSGISTRGTLQSAIAETLADRPHSRS